MATYDCTYSVKTPEGKNAICAMIDGVRFSLLPAAWDYRLPNFVAIRRWLKDFEFVAKPTTALQVAEYWMIEWTDIEGDKFVFRDFDNEGWVETLEPVWELAAGGSIRALLIHADEIGEVLLNVQMAGHPTAIAVPLYTPQR